MGKLRKKLRDLWCPHGEVDSDQCRACRAYEPLAVQETMDLVIGCAADKKEVA